jgi:hypothetical protein
VFERRLTNKVGGLTRENYDSGAIAEYADLDNLGLENPVNMTSSRNPTAGKKRIKVDYDGNELGD